MILEVLYATDIQRDKLYTCSQEKPLLLSSLVVSLKETIGLIMTLKK